jgi:hypothetical protein
MELHQVSFPKDLQVPSPKVLRWADSLKVFLLANSIKVLLHRASFLPEALQTILTSDVKKSKNIKGI